MKNGVAILMMFLTTLVYSQDAKRINFGFNLGVNYSNLVGLSQSENASSVNKAGLRLGVLADIKLAKFLYVSPKAELSFNDSRVDFYNSSFEDYQIYSTTLDFMSHFIFKKKNDKLSPYIFVGPNVKMPISSDGSSTTVYKGNNDFAIDFGIGLEKNLKFFNFAPELRYSMGLRNVNSNPMLEEEVNFHNISLVLNFY